MNPAPTAFDFHGKARSEMFRQGFKPDFPAQVMAEVNALPGAAAGANACRDLRALLWSSIDNSDSRDLDQIEWAERMPNGNIRVLVGVADVDATVKKDSATDLHAGANATSVYTGVTTYPMLPTALSEGITSLNENQDRAAIVTEFSVGADGTTTDGKVYRALVHNRAQLAYPSVGAWLEGTAAAPPKVAASADLAAQLKLQDTAAQRMGGNRFQHGALDLETIETRPVLVTDQIIGIAPITKNRASSLIEEFMIAANGVIARTFEDAHLSSIRRVVRTPKRWDRIVELAKAKGYTLPAEPDSKALNDVLLAEKQKDPDHFPDVSLTVIKLLGPGEYILVKPDQPSPGHFGLAVQDYTHSTAPNRRFPDVITQRLLKSWLTKQPATYSDDQLDAIAQRCTQMEDAARKVERDMQKRIAAVALHPHIGQSYPAIVTGVNNYGTFVRTLDPHVDGKVVQGGKGLDVGDRVTVKLVSTDPVRGFIDFAA
jgi:exoribonuclease-2